MLQQLGKPKINSIPGSSDKVNNPASCASWSQILGQYGARFMHGAESQKPHSWQRDGTVNPAVVAAATTPMPATEREHYAL